jgi:hypothetical protein
MGIARNGARPAGEIRASPRGTASRDHGLAARSGAGRASYSVKKACGRAEVGYRSGAAGGDRVSPLHWRAAMRERLRCSVGQFCAGTDSIGADRGMAIVHLTGGLHAHHVVNTPAEEGVADGGSG